MPLHTPPPPYREPHVPFGFGVQTGSSEASGSNPTPQPIWPTAGAPTSGPNPTPNLIVLMNYYVGLLIKQYATLPNAQRTIAILGKQIIIDDLVTQLLNAFTLATAVGVQLDIIGKYIGQSRNIQTLSSIDFFGCVDTTNTVNNFYGCTNTTNPAQNSSVYMWDTTASRTQTTSLPDEQYRVVLILKAALNTSNGTLANVINYLWTFFGSSIQCVDNHNMSVTYNVSSTIPITPAIAELFLPKPMGSAITVNIV